MFLIYLFLILLVFVTSFFKELIYNRVKKKKYNFRLYCFYNIHMINFDDYTCENKTEHSLKWLYIPDHSCRI